MSGASNFGFSKDPLFSGLATSPNVNASNSNYSGDFTSTQIPSGPHSLTGVSNNVAAAAASKAGGGMRKINNLARRYRTRTRRMRYRRTRTRHRRTRTRRTRRTRVRRHRGGGYLQYMSNNPSATTFATAATKVGPGTDNPIAMANPPTFSKYFPLPGMKGGSCGCNHKPMRGGTCGVCNQMPLRGGAPSLFESAPTIPCNGTGNNYNHFTGKCVGPLA